MVPVELAGREGASGVDSASGDKDSGLALLSPPHSNTSVTRCSKAAEDPSIPDGLADLRNQVTADF